MISVIGGINIDIKGIPYSKLIYKTSNPGYSFITAGGVGRNIAHNIGLLGEKVVLFSAIGDDLWGNTVLEETRKFGVNTDYIKKCSGKTTGMYLSILNHEKDMELSISSMETTEEINDEYIDLNLDNILNSRYIILDTNLKENIINYLLELIHDKNIQVLVEPVSHEKAKKISNAKYVIDYITPNFDELSAIYGQKINNIAELETVCKSLSSKFRHIIVTMGENGVYHFDSSVNTGKIFKPYKAKVVDANGAGDSFVGGFMYSISKNKNIDESIKFGMAVATLTLESPNTVNNDITLEKVYKIIQRGE